MKTTINVSNSVTENGVPCRALAQPVASRRQTNGMTSTAWLAMATWVLAAEGGTALFKWVQSLRIGKTRREIAAMKRELELLHNAVWMDVSRAGQGTASDGDAKVRNMLMLDGWRPDRGLTEQAGYFYMDRLRGTIPGVTD